MIHHYNHLFVQFVNLLSISKPRKRVMATFYSSSTNQMDVMPTFYTRDPGHASYPESSTASNMMYPRYSPSVPYSGKLTGNNQSQQNCIDPPVPASMISQDSFTGGADFASHLGERPYNALRDGRNEVLFMQTVGRSLTGVSDLVPSSVADDPHMGLHTQLGILNGQNLSLRQSNISTAQRQALSLSLGTQIPVPPFQFQPANSDISILSSHQSNLGDGRAFRDDICRNKLMHSNASPYDLSSFTSTIPNSRYLKVAQQLLDEVVNVQKALKQKTGRTQSLDNSVGATDSRDNDAESKGDGMSLNPQGSNDQSPTELSPSERQDLQNKMMKLLAMLDEVDRRHKQYYHQMQIVASSFDVVAGCGAAKPYTALALETISRQFRCLRDAISCQIRATKKSLGEKDSSNSKGGGISRLKYIDQQLKQQRAMQQLGMVQHNAWRPQRGLPETSVSVLRAWLFEHFLHPYPKDSEKLMLARQTGLTRSQISNWFINARVRLWKPMIEEMYKEEIGETEMDSNSSLENIPKSRDETGSSEEREHSKSPATEGCHTSQLNESSKSNISSMDAGGTAAGFPNEASADDTFMNLMLKDRQHDGGDCGLLHDAIARKSDGSGRLVGFQMAKLGRYRNGGVSLTLGLQHCDGCLPVSNGQQSFLGVRGQDVYSAAPPLEADATDYDCINSMDQRHRFGPSPLLHDFVA
ncbi:BEL1-like homeodomain protein 7 isoform X1 [Phoenix dactylifera]|uniref:BEL1-like homeodomain protein 7 isoform X1 n=2 Tax=Phoenix dactylifera TaxID=42345 RepID=A0A8B9B2K5_PHODC|nr:BEL1-like homeodomain protein 7 isoform X1 [Phoenix dactylifera]XP_038990488.1 BEL1-like homeodomain protein 7 isoform X1 [Phoenix dactylifera]XP_038990490.1 BEL1-like homeodomain protein 7 isoform X1 [Phoenix dactylifera]